MTDGKTLHRAAGVVLVGTHQWTQSTFDRLMPRALLPVAHKPLVSYSLAWLAESGINTVGVCGNRDTDMLRRVIELHTHDGLTVTYSGDPMPRGAAGSLRDAGLALDADLFLVTDGTSVPTIEAKPLLDAHRQSGAAVTIVVHEEERRYGNPQIQVPTGVYVFDRRVLEMVPARGFCDIKEKLIPMLYSAGERLATYVASAPTPRVLCASTYMAVNAWMLERLIASGARLDGYVQHEQALVHQDARIASDAVLLGPVLVAAGAHVGSQAAVVGPTTIGCDAVIEPGAMVSRSAIWRRAVVGANAVADRCLLADDGVVMRGEEAVETVLAGRPDAALKPAPSRAGLMEVLQLPAMDVARKLGRVLGGPEWSRSPAAQ